MPSDKSSAAWRARAHCTARNFNWDYGCKKLHELIRQQCDLGTALLIYWSGAANWYRQYASRAEVNPPRDKFDMLVEIEEKVLADFYKHKQIAFDPFDDAGQNWATEYAKQKAKFRCELPAEMYRPVGEYDKSIPRTPLSSGQKGLPVGLATIAKAGGSGKQNGRAQAIAALNELNDDSFQEVVVCKGDRVVRVGLGSNHIATDAALDHLKLLSEVEELELGQIMTDKALERLRFVPHLKSLELGCTKFTDRGLVHLRQLHDLEKLDLNGCGKITDAGLANIRNLTKLKQLDLESTKIGDKGLEHLQGLAKLEELNLSWHTKITNAGLQHLAGLKKLQDLNVAKTKIGDPGLIQLSALTGLRRLVVGETKATKDGIAKLKKALPKCEIVNDVY